MGAGSEFLDLFEVFVRSLEQAVYKPIESFGRYRLNMGCLSCPWHVPNLKVKPFCGKRAEWDF